MGSIVSAAWCTQARERLAAMEALIAAGRGETPIPGGGCTEPGGGIVSVTRTARETADVLRRLLATSTFGCAQVSLGGSPVGFGQSEAVVAPAAAAAGSAHPLVIVLITSAASAATGWVIEEVAQSIRGKRRRRR